MALKRAYKQIIKLIVAIVTYLTIIPFQDIAGKIIGFQEGNYLSPTGVLMIALLIVYAIILLTINEKFDEW